MISHTVECFNPELRRERGWLIIITTITDTAFDTDEHMCEEMSSRSICVVPVQIHENE